jgi:hypothetical protein
MMPGISAIGNSSENNQCDTVTEVTEGAGHVLAPARPILVLAK